jgi:hypothetical protein
MLKIQNFKNRAVPSGWWLDLDRLENVSLSKGGANMQPKELLQMFFETGVLVGRSMDAAGNPLGGNVQPVIPIENTAASELAMFYQDLLVTIQAIEKMTGYNDITSGNPNPKTLVPGYQMAEQSTNDALFPMSFAEEFLSTELAEAVLCRMQQGVKKAGISGYATALNSNTVRFIQVSPDIALRDYGIELEKRTSDDQKAWLLQQMQQDIMNGWLDTSDAVVLVNTKNVKQAQMIWAFRVKKAKEAQQANEMAKIQQTNQGNQEVAAMAQQARMQELQMQYQFELQKQQMIIQGELEKERMRRESEEKISSEKNMTAIEVADTTAEGKVVTQHVSNLAKSNQS